MNRARMNAPAACLAAGLLVAAIGTATAKEYPKCKGNHPGRADRAARLLKDGDTDVCKSIAKHVVKYSIVKYGLEGVVTNEEEIKKARRGIYEFLKWKLGNPSAIAAQWVSAGYKHFDKAYSDEAAALVLGSDLDYHPRVVLRLPRELSDWLKAKVDSVGMETENEASLCDQLTQGGEAGGAPPAGGAGDEGEQDGGSALMGVGCELVMAAVKLAVQNAIDRIGISLATVTGDSKKWDIPNRDVELMVYARLHPVTKNVLHAGKIKGPAAVTKGKGTLPGRIGR